MATEGSNNLSNAANKNWCLQVSQIKYVSHYHAGCILHEELEATNPTVDNSKLIFNGMKQKIKGVPDI